MLLLLGAALCVFPAAAVWVWRRHGRRGLALLTALVLAALVIVALTVASEWGGNRLVQSHGYPRTAARTLLFTVLSLMLPVVASATSVWTAGRRVRPGSVYPIAVATALTAAVAGIILAVYSL